MRIHGRLDSKNIFIILYCLSFFAYIVYGLQPAEAVQYKIDATISIPSIGLSSDVTKLELNGQRLDTPDTIVGSYSDHNNKTLLIGHSTTVFQNLFKLNLRDSIKYDDKTYIIKQIHMVKKSKISMKKLLNTAEKDTIVLMTCAGTLLDNGDATHRLIITASV